MTDAATLRTALVELERRGLGFLYHVPNVGERLFDAEQAAALLADADAACASHFGLTAEDWSAYQAWMNSHYQCTGRTRAGQPCQAHTSTEAGYDPSRFHRGISDRCVHHIEQDER